MNGLVFSNFLHRPARTVVSVTGIAIGVLLIVFTVGLANGSMRERAEREANVGAEIFFRPSGSVGLSGSETFGLPLEMAPRIEAVEGVSKAVPLGQNMIEVKDSKTGERLVDGIDFASYAPLAGMQVIEGRKLGSGDEAMVDTAFQQQKGLKIGDKIPMWEREFTVIGTYEPAAGARVKIPLKTMQDQLGGEGKATAFLVKIDEGAEVETVADNLHKAFPDNQLLLTKDLEELYMSSVPALGIFLNVIVGVAAVISALVVLLTMYTTVTERTRQIGIMKSLGMSNPSIAWLITQEALLISASGIVFGVVLTVVLRFLIGLVTTLTVELSPIVILIITIVGLIGGALGGLYPALRAARMDAVESLSYE
jgi:putative ABC transport system permease protein